MAFIESGKTFDKDEHHVKMRKRMDSMDICQYSLRVPAPLYKKVKIKLAKEQQQLSKLLVDMLEKYIKE